METKSLGDLVGNPKNPRSISKSDFDSLKRSIIEFGDLSGIVFNRTTSHLVGGHQRVEAFKRLGGDQRIEIVQELEQPTKVGTIAIGFVQLNGERYGYREVVWPADREMAANIAANRISGDFDHDLLAEADQMLKDLNPDLLVLTGQSPAEIAQLLGGGQEESQTDDPRTSFSVKLTEKQYPTVEQAMLMLKSIRNIQAEGNDDMDANALYYICLDFLTSHQ